MRINLAKIILLLLVFQACRAQKEISSNLNEHKSVILGEWRVSREENTTFDGGYIEIWRRPSYSFPPSRFRNRLIFNEGGVLTYNLPGADDRPLTKTGSWKIETIDNKMMLIISQEIGTYTAEIVSLEQEKLALKKHKE